jgi:hypothetical protein
MGEAAGQRDLSDVPVTCPLCHQVHERCVFTAGSLYCARPGCRNPHHREPPPEADPSVT